MRATLKLLLLLSCFCVMALLPARADSQCSLTTPAFAFGSYDSLGSASRDSIGTITVTCTGNTGDAVSYYLSLSTTGQQGGYRIMTNGGHQLNYLIFADNGYTQVWGDGTGGSIVVSDSYTMNAHSTSRSYPMYGRIPAGQSQTTAGAYGANVTVTLKY